MRMVVKVALAAVAAGTFVVDACLVEASAQSQGPLTAVPWASRSRTVKAPGDQPAASDQVLQVPPTGRPVDAAPEPDKPRTADRQ